MTARALAACLLSITFTISYMEACEILVPNHSRLRRGANGVWRVASANTGPWRDTRELPCAHTQGTIPRRVRGPMVTGGRETTSVEFPYTGSENITSFTASMTVPELPTASRLEPLTFWPGLEDTEYGVVFQPLLSLGDWTGGSSSKWYIQSAFVELGGSYRYSTPRFDMNPGDKIDFSIQVSGDQYTVTTSCLAQGVQSVLTITHSSNYVSNRLLMAYESIGVGDTCTHNPPSGKARFSDITASTTSGALDVQWRGQLGGMTSDVQGPACAQRATSTSGAEVVFLWDSTTVPWWDQSDSTVRTANPSVDDDVLTLSVRGHHRGAEPRAKDRGVSRPDAPEEGLSTLQEIYFGAHFDKSCSVCGLNTFATSHYPGTFGGALWVNGYVPFHSNVPGSGLVKVNSVGVVLNGLFGCHDGGSAGPSTITVLLNGHSSGPQSVQGTCEAPACNGCNHSPVFTFPGNVYLPGEGNMLQVVVAKGNYAAISSATLTVTWTPFSPLVARAPAAITGGGSTASCNALCAGGMKKVSPGDTVSFQSSNPMSDWATLLAVSVVVNGKFNCGALGVLPPHIDEHVMTNRTIRARNSIPSPGVTQFVTTWNSSESTSRWFFPGQGNSACSYCESGLQGAVWDLNVTDKFVHQNSFSFSISSVLPPYPAQLCNASVYFFYAAGHPPTCYKNCSYPHGQCVNAKCVCTPPYFGLGCTQEHCKNNCTSPSNGVCNTQNGQCECIEPFYGCDCSSSTHKCPNDCSGNGVCNVFTGECQCNPQFTGAECSVHLCPNNCGGPTHGTCDSTTGKCQCKSGWHGPSCCELTRSCPSSCSGHGTCDIDTGVCTCNTGFWGPSCNLTATCPENCNSNGVCNHATGVCKCSAGWYGCSCNLARTKDEL